MRFLTSALLMSCAILGAVAEEAPETVRFKEEQYKRIHQEALRQIVDNNAQGSVEALLKYLKKHPDDFETHYCLAAGYGALGESQKALEYLAPFWVEESDYRDRILIGLNAVLAPVKTAFLEKYPEAESGLAGVLSGPMLGDIQATGIRVWVRSGAEVPMTVCVRPVPDGDVTAITIQPRSTLDYTAEATITGLTPETDYEYWVVAGDRVSGEPLTDHFNFSTPVMSGTPTRFRAVFGGGAGYVPQHEYAWNTVRAVNPDMLLLLGDNIYSDDPTRLPVVNYSYYRRQSRPEFRQVIANTPVYAVWDDHDFGTNDCLGGAELDVPAWKGPVWNTFKNNWVNPYYGGGEESRACYFNFTYGDVEFFMLDSRYYRTAPFKEDSTMLGPIQKAWLKDKIAASRATFKVICTPVPWSMGVKPTNDPIQPYSGDTWDGFANEREELNQFIDQHNIEGIVILAADRHRSDLWRTDRPDAYPHYELMSSRFTNQHVHKEMEKALFSYNKKQSFGVLDIDTTLDDPTFSYSIMSIDGEGIFRHIIRRSELNYPRK